MTLVAITGVSRGLGREMALGFASAGCTVCGCGQTGSDLQSLKAELGDGHNLQVVDVANDLSVAQWAESIRTEYGVVDYLINNAAVINHNQPLWEVCAAEFDQLTAININGVANTIRHFVPAMVTRKQGVIVNFSSGWGRSVSAEVAPYCASKWAIEGLTQALAEELPDGMAAIPLNPGVINTQMLQSCFAAGTDGYPVAAEWAATAVPYILGLTPADNGRSLSVPGH